MNENQSRFSGLGTGAKIGIGIVAVIVLLVMSAIGTYNSLVGMRENVDAAWSNVDTQLQRRSDLIPNLVETVKGYAAHETKIFTEVAEARAKLAGASSVEEKIDANNQLTGSLGRLLAIAEAYPDLKANTNYQSLMDELAGTENRISVARQDYNAAAKSYNAKRRSFPTVIFANMLGFKESKYFEAQEGAETAPSVNFTN